MGSDDDDNDGNVLGCGGAVPEVRQLRRVDIQSYTKFSAMSDALNATGVHIVFS